MDSQGRDDSHRQAPTYQECSIQKFRSESNLEIQVTFNEAALDVYLDFGLRVALLTDPGGTSSNNIRARQWSMSSTAWSVIVELIHVFASPLLKGM
jgi:hypothetical protein